MITLGLYALSTISGMSQARQQKKQSIFANQMNSRIAKVNASFEESAGIENQIKQFKDFSEQHAQIAGSKKVGLMTGGISSKSSVFAGVEHETDREYYSAVQEFKDNLQQIRENKKRADINADLGMSIANNNAMNSYNGFNALINNAMSYYTYLNREGQTAGFREQTAGVKSEIGGLKTLQNQLTSSFGYSQLSALGGKK